MNRRFAVCAIFLVSLLLPGAASAASGAVLASGNSTGTVTAIGGSSFTIQTSGRPTGVVNALTAAANNVTRHAYPYVYGGGHSQAGIASIGIKGQGYNGRRIGFDCSGSVAAVLAGGGLWAAGSGVPNDAGIVATLLSQHLIARGVGKGPVEVTLYDHPGVHIFMNVDGRFFGTSDGGGGGNPRGGAGWLDDGAPDASRSVYKAYHFLPWVLKGSTSAGHIMSFQFSATVPGDVMGVGDPVQVSYTETRSGSLVATAVSFPGAASTSGTVTAIAPDESSFAVLTGSGSLMFTAHPSLLASVGLGDSVVVTYTSSAGTLTARSVNVTAIPPGAPPAGDGG